MPEPVWYRSLYWRVAFGFVGLLASLLAAQGLVFLWMAGQADFFSTRSPGEFAASMANEISGALVERPDLNLASYVAQQYPRSLRRFAVVMRDGQVVPSVRIPPPPNLIWTARSRFAGTWPTPRRGTAAPEGDRYREAPWTGTGRGPAGDGRRGGPPSGWPEREFGGRGRGGWALGVAGGADFADILAQGDVVGVVAVTRDTAPLGFVFWTLAPSLGLVALGLLGAGTAVAAFAVFRPTRRRLGELQTAVRAIGAGDFAARAPVFGGDEVASLSESFNEMAVQLEERTRALEAADRTRRQLLADVSHELMTPLAAIRGYVETLGMADLSIDEPTRTRYLGIVDEEATRLQHVIGDLLDLARFEGGGGRLNIEPVEVSYLLERIQRRHRPVAADRQVAILTECTDPVRTIHADPNRLEQALQNLVANAVRHTPAGGHVRVTVSSDQGHVSFVVEDNGPGIPPEHLTRIFDRFHKVDESRTGTATPSGSGLGLSIVQAIVVRHRGTVTAANRPGGGARFEIRLPQESLGAVQ